MRDTYELATKLANDLAEDYIASKIADMMIPGSREKAKAIRELSEANADQSDRRVKEYRREQRAIHSSLYNLIKGYKGYKIVKDT
tara:strand:+ start:219 stop:473 length:255 start_codon:yes stop_codon:yes gene_type:complete